MRPLSSPIRSALLAALVAGVAPAALAQSSVTMYGLIDLSIGSAKAPGGASDSPNINSGNMTTSFIGVKGTEDLGGGLKAVFALESFMRSDAGQSGRFDADTFWARSAYVGVSSSAGTVTLGRNTTSLFVNTLIFNSFGDSFGFSPAIRQTFTSGGAVQVSGDTGWSDSIKYASPNFGGLSFTGHYAAAEGNGGRNLGVSALYFGGPFAAGFAWQAVEKGTGAFNPDTTAWQLGGSFNMAPVKLYAQYGTSDNKTINNTTKVLGLGADYALGAGKLMAQWNQQNPDVGADLKTLSFGYGHQLSKSTDLYAVYMNEKKTGLSTGNSYAVGMRHRF
ncbi:MAG: porin [Aquabacterium sp.]|nr:porin [Aquabacterium sp.]